MKKGSVHTVPDIFKDPPANLRPQLGLNQELTSPVIYLDTTLMNSLPGHCKLATARRTHEFGQLLTGQ